MRKTVLRVLVLMAMLAAVLPVSSTLAAEPRCEETPDLGFRICEGGFLGYWEAHGGLPIFGYAMSEEIWDEESQRTVQYTERQRFESHLENASPYHVLLGLLGDEDAKARGYMSRSEFQKTAQRNDAVKWFPETEHNITSKKFAEFWESHGLSFDFVEGVVYEESLALFGFPISEEFVDPTTGFVTQYFQRAVFEYHPENPEEWQVLLRRVGADAADRKLTPPPGENPPPPPGGECGFEILAGATVVVPVNCIVVGDIEASAEGGPLKKLHDDHENTGLVFVIDVETEVFARWGATVTSGDPLAIQAQQLATGCGGGGCSDVPIWYASTIYD